MIFKYSNEFNVFEHALINHTKLVKTPTTNISFIPKFMKTDINTVLTALR